MKKYPDEMFISMVKDLEEGSLKNGEIAEKYGCSLRLVENFNGCKCHIEFHNYKNNIRREANNQLLKCINEYTIVENGICSVKITNTNKETAICYFDYDDLDILQKYSWTIKKDEQGHYRVRTNGKDLHQYLLDYDTKNFCVDHIDRNPLNNCRNNLRITNSSINSINARARTESKTGIRGVYFRPARPGISKDSWICEWSIDGKRHTKSFSCAKYGEEEAFELAKSFREEKLKEMKI